MLFQMQASTESLGRVKTATSSQSGDSPHGLRRAFTSATSLVFSPSSRSRAGSRAASSSGLSDLENFERRVSVRTIVRFVVVYLIND